MRINQNVMAFNASRNLSATNVQLGKSLEKLSSGFRINRAGDDAAGLVISQGLRAQISGLRQATRNAQDGISVVQTAEGALNEVHSMLNRMRDLAVQAANTGTTDSNAAAAIQAEFNQLVAEVDRVAENSKFGTMELLDGTYTGTFQVGANAGDVINVTIADVRAEALGLSAGGTVITADSAAIAVLDTAINTVSEVRGALGALQNRFESTINNLSVTTENLAASESRIRDTDMAAEMVAFTRNQVLQQAGTAMLAQANQVPQTILLLLR